MHSRMSILVGILDVVDLGDDRLVLLHLLLQLIIQSVQGKHLLVLYFDLSGLRIIRRDV